MRVKINKDKILVLIILIIAISAFCINAKFEINDELWNFSNINKMCNGSTIYKDINVIITPLFFYIGQGLFSLIGANYLVFRIYNILIFTMFFYLIYSLFITLKTDKVTAKIYTSIIFIISIPLFTQGANYNILVLNFVILGILSYIKYADIKVKGSILQGIIIFLIFLTKQNCAVYYVIGLIIINIIKIINDRKKLKQYLLNLTVIAITSIALVSTYIAYLALTNNLYNAINYTILGMGEFTQNAISSEILYIVPVATIIIILIYIVKNPQIPITQEAKGNIKVLLSFSIPMLGLCYPLMNRYHFQLAIYTTIITFLYTLDVLFIKEIFPQIKYKKIIRNVVIISSTAFLVVSIVKFINRTENYSYNQPYYGANMNETDVKQLEVVCNYIATNKNVYVISYQANFYANSMKTNNGVLDLPFVGNLGKEGEQGLINKIEQMENVKILISKEEFHQYSLKVREYIEQNCKQVGEIESLLIYEK